MKPLTVSSPTTPCPAPRPLARVALRISDFGFRISTSGLRTLRRACLPLLAASFAFQSLADVVPGHVLPAVARLQPLGRLPASQRLNLGIGLPLRNQAQLAAFLRDIYDPASRNYRAYLTPREFTDRFGPSQQDYQAVIDFAQANNLKVTATSPNRVILNVDGTVADIEKTFHLTLRSYQHPTEHRTFYAPDSEPSAIR